MAEIRKNVHSCSQMQCKPLTEVKEWQEKPCTTVGNVLVFLSPFR